MDLFRLSLEAIVKSSEKLSAADLVALKSALKSKSKRKYRQLCGQGNVWIFESDLEDALLPSAAEATAHAFMVQRGLIGTGVPAAQQRSAMRKRLHGLGNEPEVIGDYIDHMAARNAFSGGQFNACFTFLFGNK